MRRSVSSVVVLTLLSLLLTSRPAVAAPQPLPADATIHTRGHGWGHGRGLGQWGARGMAETGASYTRILRHYYSGITWASRPTTEDIRVLVEESSDVIVTSDAPFRAAWSNGTPITTSDSTYRYLRVRWDGTSYRVERSTSHRGPWSLVRTGRSWVVFTRGSAHLDLVLATTRIRTYRGQLIARRVSSVMRSINQLPLQEYLYAVVPSEMPSSWPTEALRSQAVAARTYAVYKKDHARAQGYMFDICATTSCQVYRGYATRTSPSGTRTVTERASTNRAVQDTAGRVLLYRGRPILAEYSSSSGGYTAPGNVPYQRAVPDPGDAVSSHHDWRAEIRVREIEARWPSIGRLVDIRITRRNGYGDWGGRVLEMRLVGTAGSVTMSGNSWRSAFAFPARSGGVQSNWFTIWYWRGDVVHAPASVTITAGDSASVPVHVRNSSSLSWAVGSYVRLGTAAASRFADGRWISPTRASAVTRNLSMPGAGSVAPGQVAEFVIPLRTAGLPAGVYSERFNLVADGWTTMAAAIPLQIEVLPGWTEEAANLLTDGSFESGRSAWTATRLATGDGPSVTERRDGSRSYRLSGGASRSVRQTVRFDGSRPRAFVLAGWSKTIGSSASGGSISVWAHVNYTDGSRRVVSVPFWRATHAWTFGETSFTTSANRRLASITVGLSYSRQTGRGYFDAIRLLESPFGNPSFEDGLDGWSASGLTAGDGSSATAARDGVRSLRLTGGGTKRLDQVLTLDGGATERYVVSAWTRVEGSSPTGGRMGITLTFFHPDGTTTSGVLDFPKGAHPWTRHEATVAVPRRVTRAVMTVSSTAQTGTLRVDGIRVLRTLGANPSFESGMTGWRTSGFSTDDGIVSPARDGAAALRLIGPNNVRVVQRLAVAGPAGQRFVLSGWNRSVGTSASGGLVGLIVSFRNTDGTSSSTTLRVSGASHPWTYLEAAAVAPKRFQRVDLYAVFYDQRGRTYFDSIRFARA